MPPDVDTSHLLSFARGNGRRYTSSLWLSFDAYARYRLSGDTSGFRSRNSLVASATGVVSPVSRLAYKSETALAPCRYTIHWPSEVVRASETSDRMLSMIEDRKSTRLNSSH